VGRLACVDVPALPLQLLLRRHPEWARFPAVVVDEDKPQGQVLWASEPARRQRVLPGMRYAAALSLARGLRAGAVAEDEIAAGVAQVVETLRGFTPDVEPAAGQPGVFWLRADGLTLLYPSLEEWGQKIHAALRQLGFTARVVVGWSRFGSYAAARGGAGAQVVTFPDAAAERRAAARVTLDRLDLPPAVRDELGKLGVRTAGALARLPASGLRRRYGAEAHRLHQMASGDLEVPLHPAPAIEPIVRSEDLEHAETDASRLLFGVRRALPALLAALARRGEALAELRVKLTLERAAVRTEGFRLSPAAPTLDEKQIVDLVRLRLETASLRAGVTAIDLEAVGTPATVEQLRLFAEKPRRDLRAAAVGMARVRARFGDAAVVRARLLDGHLPEARFGWEEVRELPPAAAASSSSAAAVAGTTDPPLVRRIYARPQALFPPPEHDPDGWRLGEVEGAVVRSNGPFAISGGWWAKEVHREYHFAETERGHVLWVFYDRRRRRWFLQGRIE
jgi:protein ImuB